MATSRGVPGCSSELMRSPFSKARCDSWAFASDALVLQRLVAGGAEQFECDQLLPEEAAAQGGDHFLGDLRGEEVDERNLERRFGRIIVIVIGAPLGRGRQVVGKDNRRED